MMEKEKVKKTKGIYDVFLVAYLQSHNFKLVSTQKGFFYLEFCFESTSKLEEAISDYFGKKDKTPALSFAEHYRSLRAMIRAFKFGNSGGIDHDHPITG